MSDLVLQPIDSILGEYQISDAVTPDGRRSHGFIRFRPHGLFAHSHGLVNRTREYFGIAVCFRDRLLLAAGPQNKVEIGAYHLDGDSLTGLWIPPGATGNDLAICGFEQSRRVGENLFEIEKAHAVDQQPYTGRLILTYLDDPSQPIRRVRFNWALHDGEYSSFGLAHQEVLVGTFNFEPNTSHSISLFHGTPERWSGGVVTSDSDDRYYVSLSR